MNKYPRGSEWRKWDLQVQTRLDAGYRCLGNSLTQIQREKLITATGLTAAEITSQEESMSEEKYAKLFVAYLTLFTDISVIAVTDHNTGKELGSLIEEAAKTNGKLTILPGVEVSSSQGIHMLCIFNPEKPWKDTWAESINHFLTEIRVLENGFNTQNQPTSTEDTCQTILEKTESKGGLCIFAHIGTQNGLLKSSNTASGGSAHIAIYTQKLCRVVQVPHTASLSSGAQAIIDGQDAQYGNKSVTKIKCSDARKLSDIGSQFTWIKADPTFEGLKQIIFEPNERVRLQSSNPYKDRNKIYFESLKLAGSTNYVLPDFSIPLNRELVAIIGGRGSGKSALLETVAFLNEEHLKKDQNGKKKVIEYYRDNEENKDPAPAFQIDVTLIDKNDVGSSFQKDLEDRSNLELPFLYLGQEQLSGIATNDIELTKVVCQLIGIDVDEPAQEALISKARTNLSDIENTQKQIDDICERYTSLGYTSSTNLVEWVKAYLKKLLEQQKRLSSKETKTILEDINKKTQQGIKLKEFSQKVEVLTLELREPTLNSEIKEFNIELKKYYPEATLVKSFDVTEQLKVLEELQKQINSDLDELRKAVIAQKSALIKQGIKEDVNSLIQASETLQRQISGVEKDLENYVKALATLKALYIERGQILVDVRSSLEKLKSAITSAFTNFQSSRDDSTTEEKDLFRKIIEGISVEGSVEFNHRQFTKAVLDNFIDNRKIPNEAELKKLIAGTNKDGSPKDINFESLSVWIQGDLSTQGCFNRGGLDGMIEYVFTQWPSFIKVKAIAKLNGKRTETLSIGQRGTLLLRVYLATSTARQILIIDQPEDNLDNNFIMNQLVPLIRKAKHARQIIMSTHNANLVVNADADQVIVARLDEQKDYLSGGIEDPAVNTYIRDVLEGGETAFRRREEKYLV